MNMAETLLIIGGVFNLAFAVFHLLFWRIFGWNKELAKLSFINRAIVQVLNLCLTFVFVIFAYVSFLHPRELLAPGLGRSLVALIAAFWLLRAIEQMVFFRLRHWASWAFLASFLEVAASTRLPWPLAPSLPVNTDRPNGYAMPHSAIYALVLVAAIAHASWNAMVKSSADRLLMLASIRVVGLVAGCVVALAVPLPSLQSVPFLLAAALVHYLYYALMLNAYRVGDMSQVYPIARGIAPLLVALLAALVAGEVLGPLATLAVLILCAGILALALSGQAANRSAIVFAVLTGVAIAGYSFLSGIGVRRSESVFGYIAWLEIATGLGMTAVACVRRKPVLVAFVRTQWRSGLLAGVLSVAGYATVLWAMSVLAMAPVVALRETSVVFAAVIGSIFLREGFAGRRVAAAAAVLVGAVLLGVGANAAPQSVPANHQPASLPAVR